MKRIFYFLGIAALMLTVSCKKDNKPQGGDNNGSAWDNVKEDGFYVAGPATGSDEIKGECVMVTGINENTNPKVARDGMYEKYIVLEGGKDFYLLLNEAGTKTRYSAELKEFVTPTEIEAYGDNPEKVLKGKLVTGDSAPAMKVAKTGLYHIVLDLNKTGDLDAAGGAQILLLDVSDFGIRGDMNSWGYTAFTVSEFSNAGTTFVIESQEISKGQKFKYAGGGKCWKVTLDDAGKVKAETSLGEGCVSGASDIVAEEAGIFKMTLTFKLAGGAINKSFTAGMEKIGDLVLDPATFNVGISGDGFEGGWGDPAGSAKAEFVSTTATEKGGAGDYVYELKAVNIPAGKMKLRYNGLWFGIGQAEMLGDITYEDGNEGADMVVNKPGQYKVVFTAKWDGEGLESLSATFTYLGELKLDPSTFKVGVSGSIWKDGSTDYGWNDPFEKDGVCTIATFKSKNVTDNATLAGTYVYEIASIPVVADGEFKLRFNGAWLKAELEATVEGVEVTSTGGGDPSFKFAAGTDGDYKVTITAVWDGEKATSVAGKFEKL